MSRLLKVIGVNGENVLGCIHEAIRTSLRRGVDRLRRRVLGPISGQHGATRIALTALGGSPVDYVAVLAGEHVTQKLGLVHAQASLDNIEEGVAAAAAGAAGDLGLDHVGGRERIGLHAQQPLNLAHLLIRCLDKVIPGAGLKKLARSTHPVLALHTLWGRGAVGSGQRLEVHSELQEA